MNEVTNASPWLASSRLRRRVWWLLVLTAVAYFGVLRPARYWLLDFRTYYSAGLALHEGLNPYDTALLKETFEPRFPGRQPIMQFAYPPPTLGIVYLFAFLPLEQGQMAWSIFQLGLLVVTTRILLRAVKIPYDSAVGLGLTALALLGTPALELFRWGQWDGLVVVCIALAFAAQRAARPLGAGLAIGAAALTKFFPAFYLWLFILRREWRSLSTALLLIAVLMTFTLLPCSAETRADYWHNTTFKASGHHYFVPPANMSLFGMVHRALVHDPHGLEPNVGLVDWPPRVAYVVSVTLALLIVAVTSVWLAWNRRRLDGAESLATLIPVLLMITPVAWSHHMVQLLVPIALLTATLLRSPRTTRGDLIWFGLIVLGYAFNPVVLYAPKLPPGIAHLVTPTTTYALLATWVFMLWRYLPLRDAAPVPTVRHQSVSDFRETLVAPSAPALRTPATR